MHARYYVLNRLSGDGHKCINKEQHDLCLGMEYYIDLPRHMLSGTVEE